MPLFVEDLRASLKLNPGSRTVTENSAGSPAVSDFDTLDESRLDFLGIGGHFVTLFEGYHLDVLGAETQGRARDIDGHVAAANDNYFFSNCGFIIRRSGLSEKIDTLKNIRQVLAFHAELAALMDTDSYKQGIVFGEDFSYGNIFSNPAV